MCVYVYIYLSVLHIVFCFVKLFAMTIAITKATVKAKSLTFSLLCIPLIFYVTIFTSMELWNVEKWINWINKQTLVVFLIM
jgi:hypothetical protein